MHTDSVQLVLAVLVLLQAIILAPSRPNALFAPRSVNQPDSETSYSVVINEFLASNVEGLEDEDGDTSDWIELYNAGASAANLAGWSLCDDLSAPDQWIFPAISLPSHAFLVIFASGKNRRPLTGELHTNFNLDAGGEYLGIFDASGQPQSEFSPTFPRQLPDVSYGNYGDTGEVRYFGHPTPGAPNDNSSAYLGIVADVDFSLPRGYYSDSLSVGLSTATPGATIRYTRNGSTPTPTSGTLGTSAYIYDTMPLRAIAYKNGYLPSAVSTHTYIMLDEVIYQPDDPSGFPPTWGSYQGIPVAADYEMDPTIVNDPRYRNSIEEDLRSLPALSIVTNRDDMFGGSYGIYANPLREGSSWERPASIELILPDGSTGFQSNAGVRIHGGESRRPDLTPKHSFRLYFRPEYGTSRLEYPLFDELAADTFDVLVVRSSFSNSWPFGRPTALYFRDQWLRDTQHDMDWPSSHGRFVHLYVDGLYWGIYDISEHLDDNYAVSYFGGGTEDYDIIKGKWANVVEVEAGDDVAWNAMMTLADAGLASNFAICCHPTIPGCAQLDRLHDWTHPCRYLWGVALAKLDCDAKT